MDRWADKQKDKWLDRESGQPLKWEKDIDETKKKDSYWGSGLVGSQFTGMEIVGDNPPDKTNDSSLSKQQSVGIHPRLQRDYIRQ